MKKKSTLLIIAFVSLIHAFSYAQRPGASYCGPHITSQAITLSGVHDTIISELDIHNPNGNCITLSNCHNVTITKCKLGPSTGNGIDLYNCNNITITDCRMDSVATGVYALHSHAISVTYIDVKNVIGPYPRGQMVQFDSVQGAGNQINYNVMENILGQSNPEDAISVYMCHGSVLDPIEVIGNWIRGGGPSTSGGGIMVGDNGGSCIYVQNNLLVNPGQYGIAISSGTYIQILNNKIYAKQQPFTNVGLYVWNQYTSACSSNTASGNLINWTDHTGASNPYWDNGNCGPVSGWSTNIYDTTIDSTMLPTKILLDCTAASSNTIKGSTEKEIKIIPNPAENNFTIETSVTGKENIVLIYSLEGKELMKQQLLNNRTQIDISNLTSGIYFIKLISDNTVQVKKLIKK
jgi:parallel beta-helix repeat protein